MFGETVYVVVKLKTIAKEKKGDSSVGFNWNFDLIGISCQIYEFSD